MIADMQYQNGKGQLVNLLRCSVEDSVDEGVRQVSAISFKNAVKKGWDARNDDGGLMIGPPYALGISAAMSISHSLRLLEPRLFPCCSARRPL
jgi:hypothetical protein